MWYGNLVVWSQEQQGHFVVMVKESAALTSWVECSPKVILIPCWEQGWSHKGKVCQGRLLASYLILPAAPFAHPGVEPGVGRAWAHCHGEGTCFWRSFPVYPDHGRAFTTSQTLQFVLQAGPGLLGVHGSAGQQKLKSSISRKPLLDLSGHRFLKDLPCGGERVSGHSAYSQACGLLGEKGWAQLTSFIH